MELSKETMKNLILLITFAVLLFLGVQHMDVVLDILGFVINMLAPFLAGGALAFILNVPMRFFEDLLFADTIRKKGKRPGYVRPVSLLITLVMVFLVLTVILLVVIPQLTTTIMGLGTTISNFIMRTTIWVQKTFADNPQLLELINENMPNWQTFDWQKILNTMVDFLKNGATDVVNSTISAVSTVVSGVFSSFIAFVFAIYVLIQKEKLGLQVRKALYALLPKKTAAKIHEVASLSYKVFSGFITGQCVEAVILGTMFFVSMSLFRMPYALLVGCLIAVMALIPIVGAFIGCGVGAFLILMVSPTQALIFVVMFLVLQQIEGNLIYPHVVGNSVGLPSLWVLVAVTVGGSLLGVVGMLVFIPATSVAYTLFRGYVYRRLREKRLHIE